MKNKHYLRIYLRTLFLGSILLVPSQSHIPTAQAKNHTTAPNIYELTILVNATLAALNHANRTGNYSVLRDLAAPSFQRRNSLAQLAQIFSGQRNRQLDISAALLYSPVFDTPPQIDGKGYLHLSGHIPTEPFHLKFALAYDKSGLNWRIITLSIAPVISRPQTLARR